jgi:succinate dehydrogenase flavin-adding protein (antitoxin of CptAB toxin-antitoxin module)
MKEKRLIDLESNRGLFEKDLLLQFKLAKFSSYQGKHSQQLL